MSEKPVTTPPFGQKYANELTVYSIWENPLIEVRLIDTEQDRDVFLVKVMRRKTQEIEDGR